MVASIRVHAHGGPEVLRYEEIEVGPPGPGQIRIRQRACGVNFIDVYYRTGLYAAPALPFVAGNEGAGVVLEVGPGVTELAVGDRVAYVSTLGGYAEERTLSADRAVRLPDSISDEQAAGMMLKGMTAQYLLRRTFPVTTGTTVLIHAAAGGVGSIACQWARHLGATVIGTVGTSAKVEQAREYGAHHVLVSAEDDVPARVRQLTGGAMCDVVYDGVGKDAFPSSLDCLRPLGMYVNFGNASGPVSPFPLLLLAQKGSLFATRPTLNTHTAKRADLLAIAGELFEVVASGAVTIPINHTYALAEAAQAHRDLEARRTTGSLILRL